MNINNQIRLYQYNNYIFKRGDLKAGFGITIKTQIDSSAFTDGEIDLTGSKQDKRSDIVFSVDFLVYADEDLNILKKNLFSGLQKIYFTQENNESLTFKWNYAKCLELSDSFSQINELGENYLQYSAKFRLQTPFLYEAKEQQLFYTNFTNAVEQKYDEGLLYDNNLYYDSYFYSTNFLVDTLTEKQKLEYFGINIEKPTYLLFYRDEFIDTINNKTNRTYNYLTYTADLENAAWTVGDGTIIINQAVGVDGNTNASVFTATSTVPYLRQSNVSAVVGKLTVVARIKQGSTGNSSKFYFSLFNSTDGNTNGSIVNITDGIPVGNGYYEHSFEYTATVSTGHRVTLNFLSSGSGTPTAGSTVYIDSVWFYSSRLWTSKPVYQANIDDLQDEYINYTNSLVYTLQANNTKYNLISKPLNLNSHAETDLIIVRLSKLYQNDWISIINTDTNSGFRITWNSITSSPEDMFLKLYTRELYNAETGEIITPYNNDYSITPIPKMLIFSSLIQTYFEEEISNFDNLILEKNTTNTKYTLAIKTLNKFI